MLLKQSERRKVAQSALLPFEEQQKIVQEIEIRLRVCDKMEENNNQQLKTGRGFKTKYFKKSV